MGVNEQKEEGRNIGNMDKKKNKNKNKQTKKPWFQENKQIKRKSLYIYEVF